MILNDPEYEMIKNNNEKYWVEISDIVREIFSRKGPIKSIKEIVLKE